MTGVSDPRPADSEQPPSQVTIRAATVDDVPEILAMIRELAEFERSLPEVKATEEQLRETLFGPDPKVFGHLAVDGTTGRPLGMAIWFLSYSTWLGAHNLYLEDLYVRPEARGTGLGRRLLQTLAGICVERGYPRLEWWVLDWNPARDFYAAIGADALTEWIPYRVDGEALRRLAGGGPDHVPAETAQT
jgi:GNAT superfamily N-acetyltransferase